jgi:hypothetical protein
LIRVGTDVKRTSGKIPVREINLPLMGLELRHSILSQTGSGEANRHSTLRERRGGKRDEADQKRQQTDDRLPGLKSKNFHIPVSWRKQVDAIAGYYHNCDFYNQEIRFDERNVSRS